MQNLITVGIPVYNSMPYLPETIESLLNQTVQDFQILAIVDGATDDSLAYLESVQHPRLKVVVQPNMGLTPTLNRMLREVTTPWLVRQDADDISYPTRVERILEHISQYPDAGMFYSLAEYYPRKRSVGLFRCTRGTPEQLRKIVQSGYLLSICHPSVTLNVEKALQIGGYRREVYIEDADMWWRMALAYDIQFIPEILVGFRQNFGSLTSKNHERQIVHGLYVQYLLLSRLWGYSPEPVEKIEQHLGTLLPASFFRAKELLRTFNMRLAERKYFQALLSLVGAAYTSPKYFLSRLRDEFIHDNVIANGVDPAIFKERKELLWG